MNIHSNLSLRVIIIIAGFFFALKGYHQIKNNMVSSLTEVNAFTDHSVKTGKHQYIHPATTEARSSALQKDFAEMRFEAFLMLMTGLFISGMGLISLLPERAVHSFRVRDTYPLGSESMGASLH